MEDDQDGDDVFVDSTDSLLGQQSKGSSKLRVLRHSDGGASRISEATSNEQVPQQSSLEASSSAAIEDALRSEQEFMEYVLTTMPSVAEKIVHKTSTVSEPSYCVLNLDDNSPMRKTSSRSAMKGNSKIGLDHLDNLCKLMEQLSELREANTKLQRRVQYLEDVKTLHELKREVNEVTEPSCQGLEVSFCEMDKTKSYSGRGDDLQEEKFKRNQSDRRHHGGGIYKSKTSPALAQDRLRERSKSVGHEIVDSKSGKKKFPKWSRVKEALGWERTTPVNYADRRQSERQRSSPRQAQRQSRQGRGIMSASMTSGSKGQSYKDYSQAESLINPERVLLASSSEDIGEFSADRLRLGTKRHTSANIRGSLQAPLQDTRRRKSTPSPTSLAQEALQQELRLGQELRLRCQTLESGLDPEQALAKLKKSTKGPWGRVKTIIQTRRDSLKRKRGKGEEQPVERASSAVSVEISLASEGEGDSCSYDQDTQSLLSESRTEYDRASPRYRDGDSQRDKEDSVSYDLAEDEGSMIALTSSPSMRRKSRWTKMKRVFGGKRDDTNYSRSVPSSPNSKTDGTAFDFENLPDDEEDTHEADSPVAMSNQSSGNAASSSEGERPVASPLIPCGSAPVATLVHELQSNLSDDFNKKILEWEKMKTASVRNPAKSYPSSSTTSKNTPSSHENKQHKTEKEKLQKGEKASKQRVKDLSWLQKEIEKVEKEKERLAKERKKYEDKAQRLENLRKTVLDAKTTNKNEVLVKTSAGEFRFEGISDDFTKKLYEWETKKGVGPELSTIALLDSSRHSLRVHEKGKLQKGISHSDTSLNDVSCALNLAPPTQTSCTSLPSLIKESNLGLSVPQDRLHPSRANSEPDLFSGSVKEASPSLHSEFEESSLTSGVPTADETYLTLLEKNASLLEELKQEEALCQGLETELQAADEKVNDMTWKHEKEMDHYRGQLWEVHRPGSQPGDLEASMKLITQRKNLVEELEEKVKQFKAERDGIEGIYRLRNERRTRLAADLSNKIKELREAKNAVSASLQHSEGPRDDRGGGADAAKLTDKETPDDGLDRSDNPDSEDRKWHSIKKNSTTSFSEQGADSEDERRRRSESRAYSEQSEFNSLMHEASASNTGCSSPMEVPDSLCSSPRGAFPPQITVRRSSAGNVSSLSGPECSESSSLNEAVSLALRLPNRRWRAASSSSSSDNDDNYSTSSDSSFLEDIPSNRKTWSRHRLHRQERTTEIPREDEAEYTYYVPITQKKDDDDAKEEATSEDLTPKISNASQNEFVPDEAFLAAQNKEGEVTFRRPNFDFFLTDDLATPTPHMERNWQFQTLSEPEPIPTCVTELETIPPVSVSPVKFEMLPQSATATVEDVYLHPKTHPKYFFEPFTSLSDLDKSAAKSSQILESRPLELKITKEEPQVSVKPKSVASFSSLKLSADSPVIKSRSPRRLKSDKERSTSTLESTQPETSTVANVSSSEKYWPKVPATLNQPAIPSEPDETRETVTDLVSPVKYPIKIPITLEETAQRATSTASAFSIKREAPINANSRSTIQAQIKAKEEMLRNYELAKNVTNIPPILSEPPTTEETPKVAKTIIHKIELEDSLERTSPRGHSESQLGKDADEDSRKFRMEERKCATLERQRPEPETEIARSSSRGFLQGKMKKLQRSKQSESTSAVGALCRQSLFVAFDKPEEPALRLPQKSSSQSAIGAKSCPSSPETKRKSRSWFPKNIFKR